MLINEGLPNYVVNQLKKQFTLSEKKIGILGMAFKAESDDIRESLSYKLKKILEIEAKQVLCADPYVKDSTLSDEKTVLEESDIIIIATPHKQYKQLNIKNKKVIDIWNILNKGGKI
jgi:UDP-N-acetyl-D-mannosaminuronic acid dehydrogenase